MEVGNQNVTSSMVTLIATGLFSLAAFFLFKKKADRKRNLPPGPPCLPLVGTIPFHGFGPSDLKKLHHKYGDIFRIYGGSYCVVILNSFDTINEAFVTKYQSFSARGYAWLLRRVNPKKAGFVCADYTPGFQQRRGNAIGIFRSLGFGKTVMEDKIQHETRIIRKLFESQNGEAFSPTQMVNTLVADVMFGLLFNERSGNNEELLELVVQVDKFFQTGMEAIILDFFPAMRFVPSLRKNVENMDESHSAIMRHVRSQIRQHVESHAPGQQDDFVHAIIDLHTDSATGALTLDADHFEFMVRDLVMAGLETTSTSMSWLLLLLANNERVQERAHAEIIQHVGSRRDVSMADREALPYVEALIMESQRYRTVAPYGLQHHTQVGDTVAGYYVPAGAQLIAILSHVHMDKRTWGDPEVFRPERFLDARGHVNRHTHLIPFSIGKRQCLGETLARQELFIFTASILQNFKILPPEGVSKLDEEGHQGFTYSPRPFQIRALPI